MNPPEQSETDQANLSLQHAAMHKLVKSMRKWVAYEDNDGHTFYAYHIVSKAVELKCFPSAVNDILHYLEDFPIPFEQLLQSLYSLSPGTENEWQEIGQTLDVFYQPRPHHIKTRTWRLNKEVKPLEVVCRKVENDIDRLQNQIREQKDILEKLRNTALGIGCLGKSVSVFRKIPEKPENVFNKHVEEAKQDCFTRIYQRTRELCRYEDETVHFYHAFKLVDLFFELIEKKVSAHAVFEKERKVVHFVQKLKELTRIYVRPLEDILTSVDSRELITLVLRQPLFSRSTHKVLSEVWHIIQKRPFDLDYEQYQGKLIPLCMGNLMLGPHVYKLMRARRVIADDLHSTMTKNARLKKLIVENSSDFHGRNCSSNSKGGEPTDVVKL